MKDVKRDTKEERESLYNERCKERHERRKRET